MLDGMRKEDPGTTKKLPVEFDVPELLGNLAQGANASPVTVAVGDCALMAFTYLLRVGEYTRKGARNHTKQTTEFEVQDVTFFRRDPITKQLRVLPAGTASDDDLLDAHGVSLRLRNQKNGWKNVCIFQEANGESYNCGARAIARRVIHIRKHSDSWQAARLLPLSTYFVDGVKHYVTQEDMSKHLKMAATMLNYPTVKNIPVDRVDTHSLRGGGANALSLSGYSDREIMKMGRWRSATFMEYIREDLSRFSEGMSRNMKRSFNFMHIAGGAGLDVTDTAVAMEYNVVSDDEADGGISA